MTATTPRTRTRQPARGSSGASRRLIDTSGRRLHVALVVAAAVAALTSSGDLFLLAALLGLAAVDVAAAGVVSLVAVGIIVRFGTSSLAAVAGAQAVLGPAGLTGTVAAATSAWAGGLALVFTKPRGLVLIAFGVSGAAIVAGPAPGDPLDIAVRALAAVVGVAIAWAVGRYVPRRLHRPVAVGLAGLSVLLAVADRLP